MSGIPKATQHSTRRRGHRRQDYGFPTLTVNPRLPQGAHNVGNLTVSVGFYTAVRMKTQTNQHVESSLAQVDSRGIKAMQIAIVEDDAVAQLALQQFCRRYASENKVTITIETFSDATTFLTHQRPGTDVVLMDIQLPSISGMQAAKQLRAQGSNVIIIFVTSAPQYAVEGYTVDALSYLLKPVAWNDFKRQLRRAHDLVEQRRDQWIVIRQGADLVRIPLDEVVYVESVKHRSVIHTLSTTFSSTMPLKEIEASTAGSCLNRINSGYLVNLRYVAAIDNQDCVTITRERLRISRSRRRDFIDALTRSGTQG